MWPDAGMAPHNASLMGGWRGKSSPIQRAQTRAVLAGLRAHMREGSHYDHSAAEDWSDHAAQPTPLPALMAAGQPFQAERAGCRAMPALVEQHSVGCHKGCFTHAGSSMSRLQCPFSLPAPCANPSRSPRRPLPRTTATGTPHTSVSVLGGMPLTCMPFMPGIATALLVLPLRLRPLLLLVVLPLLLVPLLLVPLRLLLLAALPLLLLLATLPPLLLLLLGSGCGMCVILPCASHSTPGGMVAKSCVVCSRVAASSRCACCSAACTLAYACRGEGCAGAELCMMQVLVAGAHASAPAQQPRCSPSHAPLAAARRPLSGRIQASPAAPSHPQPYLWVVDQRPALGVQRRDRRLCTCHRLMRRHQLAQPLLQRRLLLRRTLPQLLWWVEVGR